MSLSCLNRALCKTTTEEWGQRQPIYYSNKGHSEDENNLQFSHSNTKKKVSRTGRRYLKLKSLGNIL